jgi:hypothetical protein
MWLSFPSAVMIAALWSDNVVVGVISVILVARASQTAVFAQPVGETRCAAFLCGIKRCGPGLSPEGD